MARLFWGMITTGRAGASDREERRNCLLYLILARIYVDQKLSSTHKVRIRD